MTYVVEEATGSVVGASSIADGSVHRSISEASLILSSSLCHIGGTFESSGLLLCLLLKILERRVFKVPLIKDLVPYLLMVPSLLFFQVNSLYQVNFFLRLRLKSLQLLSNKIIHPYHFLSLHLLKLKCLVYCVSFIEECF